jgi:hypothetical protein
VEQTRTIKHYEYTTYQEQNIKYIEYDNREYAIEASSSDEIRLYLRLGKLIILNINRHHPGDVIGITVYATKEQPKMLYSRRYINIDEINIIFGNNWKSAKFDTLLGVLIREGEF